MDAKKGFVLSIATILLMLTFASALSIEVEKTEKESTIISELSNPAVFDFTITNKGASEDVRIYSFVGVSFEPSTFTLPGGKSTVEIKAYPSSKIRADDGVYRFDYEIKGTGSDLFKDTLAIKIIKLEDILEVRPSSIKYGDEKATIELTNLQNIKVENMRIAFSSVFFDEEKTISFKPLEKKEVTLNVKTNEIKDLAAGSYVVNLEINLQNASATTESAVSYIEQENIAVSKKSEGTIIRSTTLTRTNEGNLEVPDRIEITKNVLTRLFTTFSAEPLSTERRGVLISYRWEKDLKPGESWTITSKTNYTLPFILIILVVLSAFFVYIYSRTAVVLKKRCHFVKTTGNGFALKVVLHLKARKAVDNAEVFDRIPGAMQLYDKGGMPHKYDERLGRLSWKMDRLNAGEERIFSYIVYSKIKIVGRLELAPAIVHFVKNNKTQYVSSNRTFFASEIHPRF